MTWYNNHRHLYQFVFIIIIIIVNFRYALQVYLDFENKKNTEKQFDRIPYNSNTPTSVVQYEFGLKKKTKKTFNTSPFNDLYYLFLGKASKYFCFLRSKKIMKIVNVVKCCFTRTRT